jgi:hypothetical protein
VTDEGDSQAFSSARGIGQDLQAVCDIGRSLFLPATRFLGLALLLGFRLAAALETGFPMGRDPGPTVLLE